MAEKGMEEVVQGLGVEGSWSSRSPKDSQTSPHLTGAGQRPSGLQLRKPQDSAWGASRLPHRLAENRLLRRGGRMGRLSCRPVFHC